MSLLSHAACASMSMTTTTTTTATTRDRGDRYGPIERAQRWRIPSTQPDIRNYGHADVWRTRSRRTGTVVDLLICAKLLYLPRQRMLRRAALGRMRRGKYQHTEGARCSHSSVRRKKASRPPSTNAAASVSAK